MPHRLRDVSLTGAYVYTTERWYLGTVLQFTFNVTLPNNDATGVREPVVSVTVWSKIVRYGSDGVGVDFQFMKRTRRDEFKRFLADERVIQK